MEQHYDYEHNNRNTHLNLQLYEKALSTYNVYLRASKKKHKKTQKNEKKLFKNKKDK